MPRSTPTRPSFIVLVVLLAIEIVAAAALPVASIAVSTRSGDPGPALAIQVDPVAYQASSLPVALTGRIDPAADASAALDPQPRALFRSVGPATTSATATAGKRAATGSATTRAKPRPAATKAPAAPRALHGRNHVWSSAFGLDRSVAWFPCSRSRPPGMAVYRWGCAGRNNIYLFAHAGGPFERLHDVYVRGGLRRGMTVSYADGSGRVQRYAVAWWRVVLPTRGDFAYAAQSRPSLTLQTCVGAGDRYRLVVRLYRTP